MVPEHPELARRELQGVSAPRGALPFAGPAGGCRTALGSLLSRSWKARRRSRAQPYLLVPAPRPLPERKLQPFYLPFTLGWLKESRGTTVPSAGSFPQLCAWQSSPAGTGHGPGARHGSISRHSSGRQQWLRQRWQHPVQVAGNRGGHTGREMWGLCERLQPRERALGTAAFITQGCGLWVFFFLLHVAGSSLEAVPGLSSSEGEEEGAAPRRPQTNPQ